MECGSLRKPEKETVMSFSTLKFFLRMFFPLSIGFIAIISSGCGKQGLKPRQPIAFSHKIHAGDYQMSCQYCHSGARRGRAAMIPSVQTCIGCHQLVAATKPEVQKIRKAWDEKMPIRWTKVNVLPDFVYFNHQPHIMKNIPCQKCHGEIQTMSEVAPPFKLADMSYCVGCHRDNNASIDCYTCHR
jgi:hypothetical protein